MHATSARSTMRSRRGSARIPVAPIGWSSMDERIRTAVAGVEAYVVGGAVRDELLARPVVDIDVATPDPEVAARIYAGLAKAVLFPLSERHGAWRVAFPDGSTVDFTPLRGGIEDDLRTRDFTINAIAVPV